jgi:2-keto-3-deoxy-L-rhamnonate aldolase RhmA
MSILHNPVKKKLAQGEVVHGILLPWSSPDVVEFCGHLGFEWVFIDAEHSPIGLPECTELVRACNVVGLVPVVRVPENNQATILGYLETGAMGIIAPHINTAADAQALVDAVRYSPLGKRGAGSGTRAANFGVTQTAPEYFQRANEVTMVSALVEEEEGVRNLDEILAVEGVDAVGIGAGDLAMSMGLPGQADHPDVQKLVDDAEARILASGKVLDAVVRDAAGARLAVARGAQMVAVSVAALLGSAGQGYFAQVKQ